MFGRLAGHTVSQIFFDPLERLEIACNGAFRSCEVHVRKLVDSRLLRSSSPRSNQSCSCCSRSLCSACILSVTSRKSPGRPVLPLPFECDGGHVGLQNRNLPDFEIVLEHILARNRLALSRASPRSWKSSMLSGATRFSALKSGEDVSCWVYPRYSSNFGLMNTN